MAPPFTGTLPPVPAGCDLVDIWGTGYILFDHGAGGFYAEPKHLGLTMPRTLEEVEAYPWPCPDDYDYGALEAQWQAELAGLNRVGQLLCFFAPVPPRCPGSSQQSNS